MDRKTGGEFYIRLSQEGIAARESLDFKAFKEELRTQWKSLWIGSIEDKQRAEGIASVDYPDLFVSRGTVIMANRDYKPLNFAEIWEEHLKELGVSDTLNPSIGGVGKFVRDFIKKQGRKQRRCELHPRSNGQQVKKGGRGWLHR